MADNIQFLTIKKGTTSKRLPVFIKDPAVTTGAGKTGLLFNTATLKFYYWRENTGNAGGVSVTLFTATRGTFTAGGFIEIDSTNLPGWYEIGIPDAALATGANWVLLELWNAGGAPVNIFVQLIDYDLQDTVRLGLTALPNAAAEAAGGLYTRGAGAGQINQSANGQIDSKTVTFAAGLLPIKKNTALAGVTFLMFDSTDGRTPKTGLGAGVTAQRIIDGAAIGACTNAVAEVSNGVYKIDLSAADLNGNTITFRMTAAGADPTHFTIFTQG